MGGMRGKLFLAGWRGYGGSADRRDSPGRFFVAHELKMILAYLVQNYEIKPLAERPKTMWMGANIIPPVQAKIEVKRRKGTV